jgi:hypothetical protein
MSGLRLALVALLIVSTALFAAGVTAERSQTDDHAEPASAQAGESGESATEAEAAHVDDGEAGGVGERPAGAAHTDVRETVLGVDIESTPLIVLAAIAGLGVAVLAATPLARRPTVLLTIAAIAVALLHLAAAALAARLVARERAEIGSPGRPGTMPA